MSTLSISQMSMPQLQAAFLTLRRRIVTHAQIYFRHIPCLQRRADCIAEVVALCWQWFHRLAERGKDARRFPSVLASYAARAVRSGRRLCGRLKAKDVCSERAQRKHGFRVEALPALTYTHYEDLDAHIGGQRRLDIFEERLQDNTVSPIPEQVAFRCDFSSWLRTHSARDRRIISDMARNESTKDLAHKHDLSQGRVSQLRRQYHDGWHRFCADLAKREERDTPRS